MKQKTLQEQYNLIKEGKGNAELFVKAAKSQFPSLIRNAATLNETVGTLKHNHLISENFVGLEPLNQMEPKQKESYEIAFENFLAEQAKAEEKKTTKEVTDLEEKNFDYKDKKNIDNVFIVFCDKIFKLIVFYKISKMIPVRPCYIKIHVHF